MYEYCNQLKDLDIHSRGTDMFHQYDLAPSQPTKIAFWKRL